MCPKLWSKWFPDGPGAILELPRSLLGPRGVTPNSLESSWGLLGPRKSALQRLLSAPKRFPRQVAAIIRAKKLPKWSPEGSQIKLERRLEPKSAKPQNLMEVSQNSFDFEVHWRSLRGQHRSKMGSQRWSSAHEAARSFFKASWDALGDLRSRKKVVCNHACPVQKKFQHRKQDFRHSSGVGLAECGPAGEGLGRGKEALQLQNWRRSV